MHFASVAASHGPEHPCWVSGSTSLIETSWGGWYGWRRVNFLSPYWTGAPLPKKLLRSDLSYVPWPGGWQP